MTTISVDMSDLVDGLQADAADVITPLTDLKNAIEDTLNGVQHFDQVAMASASTLTIASDAITITRSYHKVDTEAAAASDNLATINGGSEGDILFIKTVNNARDVVVKHGTGNIKLNSGSDRTMSNTDQMLLLVFDGTNWIGHDAAAATSTDWANPGAIGATTPNTIVGTTITGNTSISSPVGNINDVNADTVNVTVDVDAPDFNGRLNATASSTSKASINVPQGTAPTSPVEGDIWNDSTQKNLKARVDGVTMGLKTVLFTNNTTTAISNTASELSMFPAGVGTLTLPANFLTPGKMFRIRIQATVGNAASAVCTFRVKIGGTTIVSRALTHNGNVNSGFNAQIDFDWTCYSTGVSGTGRGNGAVTFLNDAVHFLVSTGNDTVDTTASKTIDLTAQWSVANASSTIVVTNASVEILN